MTGRLHTCYSPVRRSPADGIATIPDAPRLACVKPVASVHPEPGSNSSLLFISFYFLQNIKRQILFVFAFCSSVATRTTPALDRLSYISKRPLSSIVFLYTLSGLELTESYFSLGNSFKRTVSQALLSCTTLSIANISMF